MEQYIHTKNGMIKKTLNHKELEELAGRGDGGAKLEIAKDDLSKAKNVRDEINAIRKYLGL